MELNRKADLENTCDTWVWS